MSMKTIIWKLYLEILTQEDVRKIWNFYEVVNKFLLRFYKTGFLKLSTIQNANIANFVLAVPLEINWTNEVFNLEM